MFKKKNCNNCGKKVDNKHEFCPYCGSQISNHLKKRQKKGDYGLLGNDDSFAMEEGLALPRGFNMLMNTLMRNLEKQFSGLNQNVKTDKNSPKIEKKGIKISISTSIDKQPQIKIKSFGNDTMKKQESVKSLPSLNMSNSSLKKLRKLPREEASTDIRRFSDRVVYEINLPEVESLENISITKLESSIEIKAVSKEKAYFKLIPVNLPIRDYNFSEGKLVLELGEK